MDFGLTPEQTTLVESVSTLAEREFGARAFQRDGFAWDSLKVLAEHDLTGLTLSEEVGGQGASLLDAVLVMMAITKVCPHSADALQASNFGAIRQVATFSSERVRREVLPRLLRGEALVTAGMSEPDAGSALTDLRTTARYDGDEVVLDGQKCWNSHGPDATHSVVWCRFGPSSRDIGAVLVPFDAPGFSRGRRELHMSGESHCQLFMDGCRVPREYVLADNGALKNMLSIFEVERMGNASRALVLAETAYERAVEHHVRRLLVDWVAAVVPGSATDVARAVAGHVAVTYGPGERPATAIGLGPVSAPGAAFLNGTSAHSLEVDDGYTPGSVHPSSVCFPAVLAAAQARGSDTTTTVRALAVALEAVSRLAAAGHPATWRNHFHNTPLAGVIGATCGVAVLHGLSGDRLHDALGVAASHAGGLFAFLGRNAEVKRVHPGKAARDAIVSVELAEAGVTGPRPILETPHGYVEAFADGGFDAGTLLDGLGERWVVLDSYIKPYPSCRHLHGPIDAVRALRAAHGVTASEVSRVDVDTYTVASHHASTEVSSLLDAQMSIPFAVATALCHDEVGLTEFGAGARADETGLDLVGRVHVRADARADADYPALRTAVVTLSLHDGRTLTERVPLPYGEPGNPVDDDELTAKLVRLAGPVIGHDAAAALATRLWAFGSLDVVAETDALCRGAA